MTLMRAIGLMSGTSMDGIDVAMIETDGEQIVNCGPYRGYDYPDEFREKLRSALDEAKPVVDRNERPGTLSAVEMEVTARHAQALKQFFLEMNIDHQSIDVIGFHGQTVLHRPELGLTIQLGDGQALANASEIPVVFDLRANDMANGGQGAPLVPVFHAALAAGILQGQSVAFVNIGGISNVTFVSEGHDPVAFDSGPGNTLIDQWVQKHVGIAFDDGGQIAAKGVVNEDIVADCLALPFFEINPPKSLDRNDFSPDLVAGLNVSDGARTLAAITAHAIFASARHAPVQPETWILCGGGRKNTVIANHLAALAKNCGQKVIVAEEAGLNGGAVEAQAWAYLAVRSRKGLPITFPNTTGVTQPTTGGRLALPQKCLNGCAMTIT